MKKIFLLFLIMLLNLFPVASFAHEKILFALDLIRHGDRNPVRSLPKVKYQWPGGFGALTPLGMQQEYKLGVDFRKLYVDKYHLLPATFNSKYMAVFSDQSERTIMSAQCVMYGLYPLGTGAKISGEYALPQGFQPIPILTTLITNTYWLADNDVRQKYNNLLSQKVFSNAIWQKKSNEYANQFSRLSEITGYKITTFTNLEFIGSYFLIAKIHHVPLPKDLTMDEKNKLIQLSQWMLVQKYMPSSIGKLLATNLLLQIKKYLLDAATNKTPIKYVLFSAHDTTILAVMSALNAPLQEAPPYAADLKFLLLQNDKNQYFVKMIYNGKTLVMPFCHHQTECSLDEFL